MMRRSAAAIFILAFLPMAALSADNMIQVMAEKTAYRSGEPVKMTVRLTNNGTGEFNSFFTSGQRYDFIVTDPKQNKVWKWSNGKMFTMAIDPFSLAPGKSVEYSATWGQKNESGRRVAAGKYYITGIISLRDKLISKAVQITIK